MQNTLLCMCSKSMFSKKEMWLAWLFVRDLQCMCYKMSCFLFTSWHKLPHLILWTEHTWTISFSWTIFGVKNRTIFSRINCKKSAHITVLPSPDVISLSKVWCMSMIFLFLTVNWPETQEQNNMETMTTLQSNLAPIKRSKRTLGHNTQMEKTQLKRI